METNYYDVLGVTSHATSEEIRQAYRRLALCQHPDRAGGSTSQVFIALQTAWEVLRDSESRSQYDAAMRDLALKIDSRSAALWADISLDDCMAVATNPNDPDNLDAYLYGCRCGDDYFIDACQLETFPDQIIPCSSCSLSIRIRSLT